MYVKVYMVKVEPASLVCVLLGAPFSTGRLVAGGWRRGECAEWRKREECYVLGFGLSGSYS